MKLNIDDQLKQQKVTFWRLVNGYLAIGFIGGLCALLAYALSILF